MMSNLNREPIKTPEDVDRDYKYRVFDSFVDLALDGSLTLEQALLGFVNETNPVILD